jgi:hypothetical protein
MRSGTEPAILGRKPDRMLQLTIVDVSVAARAHPPENRATMRFPARFKV